MGDVGRVAAIAHFYLGKFASNHAIDRIDQLVMKQMFKLIIKYDKKLISNL